MPLPPQKFREAVFQLLYSFEFSCDTKDETLEMLMAELKITKKAVLQAQEMVEKIWLDLATIDEKISILSTEYRLERISRVEKTVLRLGMYELRLGTLPRAIVLAEAVRLTRKFGTKEGSQFVNAILDKT